MVREEGRISALQACGYQVSIVLATAILFVPGIVAQKARSDGWLSLLLALIFGLIVAVISSKLALRFPSQTVIQYAPRVLGPFWGKIVGFIYVYYFFYVAYYVQRQFGELMTTAYMQETPIVVFIAILTLLSCYAIYQGLEVICRVNQIVLVIFIPAFFFLLALIAKDIRWENFLPFLESGWGPPLLGALAPGAWLGEVAVILMLAPFVSDRRRVLRTSVVAVVVLFLCMFVVVVGAIGTMGAEVVARLLFPAFSLYRRIHFATIPVLDRQDAIFMMIWVAGMLFKLTTFFYAGLLALSQWLGLKTYRPLIFPTGALLAALSLMSWHNISDLVAFSAEVFPLSIDFVNFFLTGLLLLVAACRGLREVNGEFLYADGEEVKGSPGTI
ncbi:spore germination protein [Ammonifex degensii KC4]|uniref:Spore germination protein n=1 Tax=Ammonifex degensii (strain DSM 10501 / KC4) TaxID=429009 RepID=C9RB32_AMMDK|nr:endospore germination permease [Ammonifex degensii]ACX51459.1 spore germination protein [Ammonifex degensii KC4]